MNNNHWQIRETNSGVNILLHVVPRAKRCEIAGLHNGALKLKVTAPPVANAANQAVVEFFASLLDIPLSRLHIVSGSKSRQKILHVEGVSVHELLRHFPADI